MDDAGAVRGVVARWHLLREYDRYPQGTMLKKENIAEAIEVLRKEEPMMETQSQPLQSYVTPLDVVEPGPCHVDEPTTLEESPEQTFEEKIEETRHALFHTYSADPGPIGEDSVASVTDYICPAHRWLGIVQEAAAKLMEAAEQALLEMPPSLKREAKKAHWVSDGWQSVAEGGAPEARRLMQVRAVAMLLNGLVDELAFEGRPVTPFRLKAKVGK